MKRKEPTLTWVVDYSAARAHAIRWLGDRYLVAKPINVKGYGSRPPTPGPARATATDEVANFDRGAARTFVIDPHRLVDKVPHG